LSVFAGREGAIEIHLHQPDGTDRRLESKGHAGDVQCVAISPDKRQVASGGVDAFVKIWNAGIGTLVASCQGHTKPVSRIAFSPDGRSIVSGDEAGATIVWDPLSGTPKAAGPAHAAPITSLVFSADGSLAASGSGDGSIRIWKAPSGETVAICSDGQSAGQKAGVLALAFSPDSRLLASGGEDSRVNIWDVETGCGLTSCTGHEGAVTAVAFYPDGHLLVSGSEDTTVKIWEVATGKMTSDLRKPLQGAVQDLSIKPSGALSVCRLPLQPRGFGISSDGRVSAEPSPPGVHFCLSADGKVIGTPETIDSVAFSPDGLLAAAGSWNGVIRIWETQTGHYRKCGGPTGSVNRIVFSPDSRFMVSASEDNAVRIWDPRNCSCLGSLFYDGRVTVTFAGPLRLVVVDRAGSAHGYELQNPPD